MFEQDVVIAYEVVAFDAACFWGLAFAEVLPGEHTLADSDPAVVDNLHTDHIVPYCIEDFVHRPAEEDIAHMPEVEGFVGIGRAGFDHYFVPIAGRAAVLWVSGRLLEEVEPEAFRDDQVQEAFDDVEVLDKGHFLYECFS